MANPYDRLNALNAKLADGTIRRADFEEQRQEIYAANGWGAPPPIPSGQRVHPNADRVIVRTSAAARRADAARRRRTIAIIVLGSLALVALLGVAIGIAGV
jgi:hypothetical protein